MPPGLRYWDHPRVGGEKFSCTIISEGWVGSPPRGRGKDWAKTGAYNAQGITPAWAGKRVKPAPAPESPKDHPRMGGEKAST